MKVLVVTATLGYRDSLKRTIESVKTIGGEDVRHIVIAPEDKIPFIKSLCGFDIECIAEPKGCRGIYAALNLVFYTYGRQYEYLTFINDDDYWLPDYRKIIAYVARHPQTGVVYAKTLYVNEENKVIKKQACSNQFYAFNDLFHEKVLLLTQQTTLIKSNLFFKIGGFDETYKLVADTKFWIQASLLKPAYKYLKLYVSCYTLQENQLSKDGITQEKEHQRLRLEFPPSNMLKRQWALLKYRFYNLNIYIMRFLRK